MFKLAWLKWILFVFFFENSFWIRLRWKWTKIDALLNEFLYCDNNVHCVKEFTCENSITSMDSAEVILFHSVNELVACVFVHVNGMAALRLVGDKNIKSIHKWNSLHTDETLLIMNGEWCAGVDSRNIWIWMNRFLIQQYQTRFIHFKYYVFYFPFKSHHLAQLPSNNNLVVFVFNNRLT